jgi:hypothetical protein
MDIIMTGAKQIAIEPVMQARRPLVAETVQDGIWSLAAHFGRGDEARDAMRNLADRIRTTPVPLQAEIDRLRKAAIDLRDDMIMRAEMDKHINNGEVIVEAGSGAWLRFCDTLEGELS